MAGPSKNREAGSHRASDQDIFCPVCGSREYLDFLTVEHMPVSDGLLRHTLEEAMKAPVGDITLACCQTCGYIGNRRFDQTKLKFDPNYSISLHHSPRYHHFLEELCDYLVKEYPMPGRNVLEIGCGQGYFLELLCRRHALTGYGYDPAIPQNDTHEVGKGRVTLSPEDYTTACDSIRPGLVCCRHVLQILPDPVKFVSTLRGQLSFDPAPVVYFEIPNAASIFSSNGVWCIMYEYRSYFSRSSLTHLFERAGFSTLKAEPCFADGQYLLIEAVPASPNSTPSPHHEEHLEQVSTFADAYRREVDRWGKRLAEYQASGKRLVAWSSGGRAICFFNALKVQSQIPYVVDINPDRQGCFLPRTAQKIVAPEFLIDYRPDVVIATNPTYEQEIRDQVAAMGVTCEVISL